MYIIKNKNKREREGTCGGIKEPVEKLSSLSPEEENGEEKEHDTGEKREESVGP
jgi:hypothetical protein